MAPRPPPPAQPELSPKMFAVPALLLGVKFLKIDLVPYVLVLRVVYGLATAVTLLTFGYLRFVVIDAARKAEEASGEKKKIKVVELKQEKMMSVAEYDAKECEKKLQAGLMSCVIVAFIHYKWGSPMPLLMQSVMQLVNLIDDPEVQIHLLGKPPAGKLARPFKNPNPLADLLGASETDTDAAAETTSEQNASKKTK